MTDIEKTFRKKPSLFVWLFFGIGIVFFMIGTIFPIDEPMINTTVFVGEVFFAIGILIGAILVVRSVRR